MKISVIVPTYKPKSYIFDCLKSFKQQTFDRADFEIIVVLNGCNKPYCDIIQKYIHENSMNNVILIQTDLPGVSLARNLALDIAKGKYIAFVDYDDCTGTVVENYKLTRLFESIKAYNIVPIMKARTYLSIPVAKIIDRNVIGKKRFNEKLKNGEDSLFMLELTESIDWLRPSIDSAIYYRRLRQGSATRSKRSFKEKCICASVLFWGYLKCLLKPWKYNPLFVMTRILALFVYFFRKPN